MRGLVILFMTFLSDQALMAKASDGISGSDIPLMRTGFSSAPSTSDTFNRACRSMVSARFAETIREADPSDAARITDFVHGFIPPAEFATAAQEDAESLLTKIRAAAVQVIKLKLPINLRYGVPEELIISSGFVPGDQSPLDMAGCYIRLGMGLRAAELNQLAVSTFLNSGAIYAEGALRLSHFVEQIANHPATDILEQDPEQTADFIADLKKNRVDMLVSTAQNYYWAYCNENTAVRKNLIKGLAAQYFERAHTEADLLSGDARITWLAKISRERATFLAHA